jgi:hypothetical protein
MPVASFAEYAPDQPPLANASRHVINVLPKTPTSYEPVYALSELGNSLSATCQGAAGFRSVADATVVNFAGDTTDLYLWSGTAWASCTRTVGGSYATPSDGSWQFAQFNNTVIATNGVDDMQVWSIGSSNNFARLGGVSASVSAAPVARYIATVRDFLFAGHLSTNKAGVRWSEQFNHASWVTGSNQSDSQDLPDNGEITGVVGGQYGLVFQQHGIQLFSYVGPDLIFQRDEVANDRGCMAQGSISQIEQTVFFLDSDGFYRIDGGQAVSPIGRQRVDDTFISDVNGAYLSNITSAIDHRTKIYYISYPSAASSDGTPDSMLVYNFSIDRWAKLNFGVDVLWNMYASLGTTLEGLDATYPDLDLMSVSLDSPIFQSGPNKTFAAFKSNKKLAFFEGDALDAIIDTVEAETSPFGQVEIDRIIPYIDGGTISALLGRRNRLNDAITFSSAKSQDAFGDIYFREQAARFHRARILWTPGTGTHAQGIEFQPIAAGDR